MQFDTIIFTYILNFIYYICVFILTSIGLAIVFGMLGVMNMAQGELITIGAYSLVYVENIGLPWWTGIILTIFICSTLAFVVDRYLITPLIDRPFDMFLATWGLAILIRETIEIFFGNAYQKLAFIDQNTIEFTILHYPAQRIYIIISVLLICIFCYLFLKKSIFGLKLRAIYGNINLSKNIGINVRLIRFYTLSIGFICSGFAGILLAPLNKIDPNMGTESLMMSFFVLVIGGLGSLHGLIAGSTIIAFIEFVSSIYFSQNMGYVLVLIVSVYFLWKKPNGLFSEQQNVKF